MIKISGLGDDIFSLMMEAEQKKIIQSILSAASNGQSHTTITSKGATPVFLSMLEDEGISNIEKDNGTHRLFWEF